MLLFKYLCFFQPQACQIPLACLNGEFAIILKYDDLIYLKKIILLLNLLQRYMRYTLLKSIFVATRDRWFGKLNVPLYYFIC